MRDTVLSARNVVHTQRCDPQKTKPVALQVVQAAEHRFGEDTVAAGIR